MDYEVESLEGLDENIAKEYKKVGDVFRLNVKGLDTAEELKLTLEKERAEKKEAKAKLKELADQKAEIEKQRAEAENKRLAENEEWKTLYEKEKQSNAEIVENYSKLQNSVLENNRKNTALEAIAGLTKDPKKAKLLTDNALSFIEATSEGVKIMGPAGEMDSKGLTEHLINEFPFLVDGSPAGGAGAQGGGSGSVTPKGDMGGDKNDRIKALKSKFPDLK